MSVEKATDRVTESDLETRIDAAMKLAFPLLPSGAFSHQTTFSFKFGGKTIAVNGASQTGASARADVLINYNGRSLAVLELKRPGLPLTADDNDQGLSYARVLSPSPPLVVVTNGEEFKLLESHTGQEWKPTERSDQAVADLIRSAALVAKDDLKNAVGTLMGTNPDVWVQAVRQASEAAIAELTGTLKERLLPFVEGFLIPRKASLLIKALILSGERMVIVHGQPMIGKSNVLREFAQAADGSQCVPLFIESDGDTSIIQQVADILGQKLDWSISKDEARCWLKTVARSSGPVLAIIVNGIGLRFDQMREEITDLCSDTFGKNLVLVIELDGMIANRNVRESTGRHLSKVGRKAFLLPVLRLDLQEYLGACQILRENRIGIPHGGRLSPEYRLPWVLRAVGSDLVKPLEESDSNIIRVIPSTLGLNLLTVTRESFKGDAELRRRTQGVAKAVLEDALDRNRPVPLILESVSAFVVLRRTLEKHLAVADIDLLINEGYLKPVIHESGEAVLLPRIPELVASEAAHVLSQQLHERAKLKDIERATWIANIAGAVPFGDIIAAQAIIDNAVKRNGLSVGMIEKLMDEGPQAHEIREGSKMAVHLPGFGVLDVEVGPEGMSFRDRGGVKRTVPLGDDNVAGVTYSNLDGWMILSHLGGIRIGAVVNRDENDIRRVDPAILLEVGSCKLILRRHNSDDEMDEIRTHELTDNVTIACHSQGIIEQITNSMMIFLGRERYDAEEWIDMAIEHDSIPLLSRIDSVLTHLARSADTELANFAQDMLDRKIGPAFSGCCHTSDRNE